MGGEEAAFHLWEKRDSEVHSISVGGLMPHQSLPPSYWEGASRDSTGTGTL